VITLKLLGDTLSGIGLLMQPLWLHLYYTT